MQKILSERQLLLFTLLPGKFEMPVYRYFKLKCFSANQIAEIQEILFLP